MSTSPCQRGLLRLPLPATTPSTPAFSTASRYALVIRRCNGRGEAAIVFFRGCDNCQAASCFSLLCLLCSSSSSSSSSGSSSSGSSSSGSSSAGSKTHRAKESFRDRWRKIFDRYIHPYLGHIGPLFAIAGYSVDDVLQLRAFVATSSLFGIIFSLTHRPMLRVPLVRGFAIAHCKLAAASAPVCLCLVSFVFAVLGYHFFVFEWLPRHSFAE